MTKTCRRCFRALDISAFRAVKTSALGTVYRESWCGECKADYLKQYRERRKDALRAKRKSKRTADPRHFTAIDERHRAKRHGVGATLTEQQRVAVFDAFGGRCAYCGAPPGEGKYGRLTVDHMVPLARGGDHSIENVVPCCWPCNVSKKRQTVLEWFLSVLTPTRRNDYARRRAARLKVRQRIAHLIGSGLT
jgi:5-methylcytosine-specific restriction endonuclease McrA